MGLENLLGGFARGFGSGMMDKKDRDERKELRNLQKQMLQAQVQSEKTKQKMTDLRSSFLGMLEPFFKGQQAQVQEPENYVEQSAENQPEFGESMQEKGLISMLAKMQGDPSMLSAMALGGMGDEARFLQSQVEHSALQKQREFLNKLKMSETVTEDITIGGVPHKQLYTKYGRQKIGEPYAVGGKKAMPTEAAGKLAMVEQGADDLARAKAILLDKEGNVRNDVLLQMSFGKAGLPRSEGRTAKSYLLNAMEGKIRIESGAAVPEEEIARLAVRFMPSIFDSQKLAKSKLDRLEEYLSGVVEKLDPNKNYSKDAFIVTVEGGQKYIWSPKTSKKQPKKKGKKPSDNDPLDLGF